jgi:hypothetical protein
VGFAVRWSRVAAATAVLALASLGAAESEAEASSSSPSRWGQQVIVGARPELSTPIGGTVIPDQADREVSVPVTGYVNQYVDTYVTYQFSRRSVKGDTASRGRVWLLMHGAIQHLTGAPDGGACLGISGGGDADYNPNVPELLGSTMTESDLTETYRHKSIVIPLKGVAAGNSVDNGEEEEARLLVAGPRRSRVSTAASGRRGAGPAG